MTELNIIADVAGEYDALMRLVKKMPSAPILCVGDLVDRGPKSKEVIEWVMANAKSLKGNHEDMMIDWYRDGGKYQDGIWGWNGGDQTIASYGARLWSKARDLIPTSHIEWLESLPTHYQADGLLVTHAPLNARVALAAALIEDRDFEDGTSILWNRGLPKPREYFQVFGHNSHWGLGFYYDIPDGGRTEKPWAVCLDDSRKRRLTGMHWPTLETFQEPYEIGNEPFIERTSP